MAAIDHIAIVQLDTRDAASGLALSTEAQWNQDEADGLLAAFMAEAAAMTSGRPGVCLSTLGPGSTAVLNGVASATLDRVPMLAISGQIESSREQFFTHQVVDHDRMFAPVSKLALRLDPASADTVIRKALRTAVAERPGAVHLTVTADAWSVPAEGQVSLPPLAPAAVSVDVAATGVPSGS